MVVKKAKRQLYVVHDYSHRYREGGSSLVYTSSKAEARVMFKRSGGYPIDSVVTRLQSPHSFKGATRAQINRAMKGQVVRFDLWTGH